MDKQTKTKIKNLVLELRDDFEKEIENRLNNIGIYPDKEWKDGRSLPHLEKKELDNRRRVAAFIKREEKIGIDQKKATKEFIKEASYTWINRLLGLKCMECRGLIEEMITTRSEYGDRSRYHRNFREKHPDLATKSDDGLIPCLFSAFKEVTEEIKVLFDPGNEYSLVVPRYPFLKKAIQKINDNLDYDTYREDEFLGWVYQYFNSREKKRVFEEVRTKKKKIAGSDIINVTQLYTEKYMVRFLVENSLGAMWMEMYPDSQLCNKWEYFVKDPNNSTREPKPVKEITFLDPACGSGHFLLYAFDLYYDMYLEEGIIPEDQIPEFILRYNLHGIDIDLRAIQLSALGLFMKVKSMQPDMKVQHMNLVSADAIMLDSEILEEFLEEFRDDPTAQELIETIWQGLENVRELGSLLKVEEQIDEVIEGQKSRGLQRSLDVRDWKEKGWEHWKRDLLAKLKGYYEKAAQTFDINRQMFANEACKGVQLLDLLEQRYDVVATNPPYMSNKNMGTNLSDGLKLFYTNNSDLYAAFIERNLQLLTLSGYIGMITQQSFMFIKTFEKLRKFILNKSSIRIMIHLGTHAFGDIDGEKVNNTMFSFRNEYDTKKNDENEVVFLRLIAEKNKEQALKEVLMKDINKTSFYRLKQKDLKIIYGWPMVYSLSPPVRNLFVNLDPITDFYPPKEGINTGDNEKFVKFWWEILERPDISKSPYKPFIKGGETEKYYGSINNLIRWDESEIKKLSGSAIRNKDFFFKEAITFISLSSSGFAAKYTPPGCLFCSTGGRSVFPEFTHIPYLLAFLNSKLAEFLLQTINPTLSFTVGDVGRLPFNLPGLMEQKISNLSNNCMLLKKFHLQFVINDREFKQTAIQWGLKLENKNES